MESVAQTEFKEKKGIKTTVPHGNRQYNQRPLAGDRHLWFRQPGESYQAFEAFMTYLMLPPEDRLHAQVAKTLGKSMSMIRKFSSMWSWQVRVGAYEEHYLLLKLESAQADKDSMWRDQTAMAEMGMSIVRAHFATLIESMEGGNATAVKPDALVRLMAESAKIQRMAVLGRIEGQRDAQETQEKLAERYADELAELIGAVMNDIDLSAEQQEKAKAVLEKHLMSK